MAAVLHTISIETDLITDAAIDLAMVSREVVKRHGDEYRRLERRVAALARVPFSPKIRELTDGPLVLTPPKEWLELLAEARRLGVI